MKTKTKKGGMVPIKGNWVKRVIHERGYSINKLCGEFYSESGIARSVSSIRRYIKDGEMPEQVLHEMSRFLDIHPDYLSGACFAPLKGIDDPFIKWLYRAHIDKEMKSYTKKSVEDFDYPQQFMDILLVGGISEKQYMSLDSMRQKLLRAETAYAITKVFEKYFEKNAFGEDLSMNAEMLKNYIEDWPESYYLTMEPENVKEEEIKLYEEEQREKLRRFTHMLQERHEDVNAEHDETEENANE